MESAAQGSPAASGTLAPQATPHPDRSAFLERQQSLTTMANGVAHDFNNFMAAVLGNVAIVLRNTPKDSAIAENARQIDIAASRATELVAQILTFSGKAETAFEPVDLSALVHGMADYLDVSVPTRMSIDYQLADEAPPVRGDPTHLGQLVLSLVTNASEAILCREGAIQVRTGTVAHDPDYLAQAVFVKESPCDAYAYVEVTDPGCGIPPKVLPRIFEPFFTTKLRAKGMGLPMVLGTVRSHGGAVFVTTAPDKGSCFRVLIPCSRPE